MADQLRFHPLVISDLRDAIGWYDEKSLDLGHRFRKLVDERFDAVVERPESFAFAFDDVRFSRIRRFPYILLFRKHRGVVHILGLFHQRNGGNGLRRLNDTF